MPRGEVAAGRAWWLVLPVLVLAEFFGAGGAALLAQPFRLDEFNTYTLVSDPDLGSAMHALLRGADYNPPALYLKLRVFTLFTGVSEVSLRLFALLTVIAGLLGVYCTCRRVLAAPVCLVAALALWAHPTLIREAFDARFYGPWLMSLAWFAFFLQRATRARGAWNLVGLGLTAVVTCTVHYFGVISLALVVAAHVLARPLELRRLGWSWAAVAAGPVALLGCLPFYLGQQAALTGPTWVKDRDLGESMQVMRVMVPWVHVGVAALLALAARLLPGARGRGPLVPAGARELAGLAGALLMPVVLLAFSGAVQPVMVPRYGLVAFAGCGAVLGLLLAALGPRLLLAAGAYFAVAGVLTVDGLVGEAARKDGSKSNLAAAIRQLPDEVPVVLEARHDYRSILRYAPDLAPRCAFLDFEPGQVSDAAPMRISGRDVARRYAELYVRFRIVSLDAVRRLERFALVPWTNAGVRGREWADFRARQVGRRLFELERE